MGYREEQDSMGTVRVPESAYYGSQTQRAVENFPLSRLHLPVSFIHALALLKGAAARVNAELGLLDSDRAEAIASAAEEIFEGRFNDQFVVDVFQTGSGTSTNMNMNEVLAGRANEKLTGKKGGRDPVHPNDHVNLGQSSNDIFPTALHAAARIRIKEGLEPALSGLHKELKTKAEAFSEVQKIGRTHLQDAVPIRLGDEFTGYARQMELALDRLSAVSPRLCELALGGTAVGTGLNTHPEFAERVISRLAERTGLPFIKTANHFEAQSARDAAVETSGALKTIAVGMGKIANDIRWLASGPRCGLGELNIPALQPGSSIMPGKVNPVIPEAVIQAAAQVVGNDLTITLGGQGGTFELNVMMPLIAYNLIQSVDLLAAAAEIFAGRCIRGITANEDQCRSGIEKSLALVTGLVPRIGYDRAAAIAKKAFESGKTIREVALAETDLSEELLEDLLRP